MSGSYIAEQVAEFFAERGLLPVVPVMIARGGKHKVHAATPEAPLTPLCTRALARGSVMRPATKRLLMAPPCRGCTTEHIYLIMKARAEAHA